MKGVLIFDDNNDHNNNKISANNMFLLENREVNTFRKIFTNLEKISEKFAVFQKI